MSTSSDTMVSAGGTRSTRGITSGVRRCSRPACPHPPVASMSYDYTASTVYVGRLSAERDPSLYDLCRSHLDRTSAPRGWTVLREPLVAVSPDGSVAGSDWTRGDESVAQSARSHGVGTDRGAI